MQPEIVKHRAVTTITLVSFISSPPNAMGHWLRVERTGTRSPVHPLVGRSLRAALLGNSKRHPIEQYPFVLRILGHVFCKTMYASLEGFFGYHAQSRCALGSGRIEMCCAGLIRPLYDLFRGYIHEASVKEPSLREFSRRSPWLVNLGDLGKESVFDVIPDLIHRTMPDKYDARRDQDPMAFLQHCQRTVDVMEQMRHEDNVE